MNNKMIDFINRVIDSCDFFIGFENDNDTMLVYNSIFDLLANTYELTNKEYTQCKVFINRLFSINKYSDYLLISRCNNDPQIKELLIAERYFNALEKKNNKISKLNSNNLRQLINNNSYKGNVNSIYLKAYLSYLGVICDKNEKLAINLFKELAYSCDPFNFKLLAYLDKNNCDYYNNIYNCFNEKLDNLIMGKNGNYNNIINQECELILICQEVLTRTQKINHEMFEYLFNSEDSFAEKKKIIYLNSFSSNKGKQRMGF